MRRLHDHRPPLTAGPSAAGLRRCLRERKPRRIAIPGFTAAAVLVPIVRREDGLSLVFTVRSPHLARHAGQISFPGGRREPGDRSAARTALRETAEELGLDPASVKVLGRLDDVATPTGFVITPVVGWLGEPRRFTPDRREVRRVLELPLSGLADPSRLKLTGTVRIAGKRHPVFEFRLAGATVWGATARVLRDFLSRLFPILAA